MAVDSSTKPDGDVDAINAKHLETLQLETIDKPEDYEYTDVDKAPELHMRTYIALASMLMLNMAQLLALQGPPAMLDYIGRSLNNTATQTWIPNALSLSQAVLGPLISTASDTFQIRKSLLVGSCTVSFIGSAIAPGASNIYRVIAAQALIGFGFAAVPLAYCVPSEILPRRWRPITQASMNIAACLGASLGPVIIGTLTKHDELNGWRDFYWVQMGFWGLTAIGIFVGYRPPKRHTRFDHLSIWQKVGTLDLIGSGLLCLGLALFLAGLGLGGDLYAWKSAQVLATLTFGGITLVAFALYEVYGTKTGILHHGLFRGPNTDGKTVAICTFLISIESALGFSYLILYPSLTTSLFTSDPMKLVARLEGFWIACAIGSIVFGMISTRFRIVREPMTAGYLIFTGAIVGLATIQPGDSTNAIVFACVAGFGFGAALILVVSTVQLCTPHHLIATATAVLTTSRAVSGSVFVAIYAAALRAQLDKRLAPTVAGAALGAGLPSTSLPEFLEAFLSNNVTALNDVPGVDSAIVTTAGIALKQALADSFRIIYIIAAPLGLIATVTALFLRSLKSMMNYGVDAPVEKLHARNSAGRLPQA